MATWIVGLVLIGAVFFATKHVLRAHKRGGCVGCPSSGSCCCHCSTTVKKTHIDLSKK